MVGHSGTTVTELVYRHLLKPVIQTGATVIDQLSRSKRSWAPFDRLRARSVTGVVTQLVTQVRRRRVAKGCLTRS